jgi:hypothetical protein
MGPSGAGCWLIKYAARFAVAPSTVFGLSIPAVSMVMKDLDKFDVISLASFSESLDNFERCLPTP